MFNVGMGGDVAWKRFRTCVSSQAARTPQVASLTGWRVRGMQPWAFFAWASAAADEAAEDRVAASGVLLNSGWNCTPTKNGWCGELDDLDQVELGVDAARRRMPAALEALAVVVVELVAVAVALGDLGSRRSAGAASVPGSSSGTRRRRGASCRPSRCTSSCVVQQADHRVRRVAASTRCVCAPRARARCARTRSPRTACPRQMPKKGMPLLARVADGCDLALDAALAEAARHQHAVDAARAALGPCCSTVLGCDHLAQHLRVVGDAGVVEDS